MLGSVNSILEWQLIKNSCISANEQPMTGDSKCPAHELFKQLHTPLPRVGRHFLPLTSPLRKETQKSFNRLETGQKIGKQT